MKDSTTTVTDAPTVTAMCRTVTTTAEHTRTVTLCSIMITVVLTGGTTMSGGTEPIICSVDPDMSTTIPIAPILVQGTGIMGPITLGDTIISTSTIIIGTIVIATTINRTMSNIRIILPRKMSSQPL
uniref:Uncharacterized protein n=1 Tax=Cacopsylla melanoneura TaxID=428564 RepID=A0A8D8XXJ4_9HEMI